MQPCVCMGLCVCEWGVRVCDLVCNIYQYSLAGVAKTRVITITIRLRLAHTHRHTHTHKHTRTEVYKSVLAFAMYIHHSFTRTHTRKG